MQETGAFYSFNNIRYADAPVGKLRWQAPEAPKREATVQNGSNDRVCYSAGPAWFNTAVQFLPAYLTGQVDAFYEAQKNGSGPPLQAPKPDPRETEDCLFLDVVAPKKIFDARRKYAPRKGGAAVLVWIHGGGYTTGSKSGSGNPAGLLARASDSEGREGEGVVYVALNYRVCWPLLSS